MNLDKVISDIRTIIAGETWVGNSKMLQDRDITILLDLMIEYYADAAIDEVDHYDCGEYSQDELDNATEEAEREGYTEGYRDGWNELAESEGLELR